MRKALPVLLMTLVLAGCPSGIEQQESSYKARLGTVDELVAKADGATKQELAAKKSEVEKAYAALPADKGARGDGLGKLNQQLNATIDTYKPRVESESKAKGDSQFKTALQTMAGNWQGGGVTLNIDASGALSYEKKSGGSEKSFTGKITKMDASSFEAGALGINTTFKIDKPPFQSAGAWKMVIDGTELTKR